MLHVHVFLYNPPAMSFHSSHHDCHFGSGVTVMADLEYLTSAYSSTGHAKPQANIMADRFVQLVIGNLAVGQRGLLKEFSSRPMPQVFGLASKNKIT